MNCTQQARAFVTALLMGVFLLCLTGCHVVQMGGADIVTEHVFVGRKSIPGVAQIATDSKVSIITTDESGKAHAEKKSIGQFVVVPPDEYQELAKDANAYRDMSGK